MIHQNQEENDIIESLFAGTSITKLKLPDDTFDEYKMVQFELSLPDISENPSFSYNWLMPEEYKHIDLREYFTALCDTEEEIVRANEEITLFEVADQINLVKYLIYLTDYMKENNFIWGIGRGSSVSVFLFYLIGLHKVHSVKYNLDYSDFFKLTGDINEDT